MIKILRTYDNKLLFRPNKTVKFAPLYNWHAAMDSRKISSSDDWIIPSKTDFETLIFYLGGYDIAGNKMREVNLYYWNHIDNNTDESGFSAKGAGYRNLYTGVFTSLKGHAVFVTSTLSGWGINGVYSLVLPDSGSATIVSGVGTVGHKNTGLSIRLLYTGSGTPTEYVGNDLRKYPVVVIGTQRWISMNLAETKYRNGDLIPVVIDNSEWASLATGAMCNYNNDESIAYNYAGVKAILRRFIEDFVNKYGLLYNFYAISDSRKITSSDDWTIPTYSQQTALFTYLGGASVAGNKLRETGTLHWTSPNSGATNEVGFTARGAGQRPSIFNSILNRMYFWSATPDSTNAYGAIIEYNNAGIVPFLLPKYYGHSVRLVKEASGVSDGTSIEYIGNDLKKYTAIAINGIYWLAENLAETRFRTGAIIPWYGANPVDFFTNSEWSSLSTAGCAAYNNDVANVGVGFSFPA
jgi:uncharacterized protein (TIGR02145 family)